MHDLLISIVLGIIEGLTEFLPVSSTAHIRIVQDLFHLPLEDPFWKMYAVVIQLGAILSVVVHFRKRIAMFCRSFPRGRAGDRNALTHPLGLTVLAFIVTALPCYLAEKKISQNLESLTVMGWALLIGGAAMWVIDAVCTRARTPDMEQMTPFQAAIVGLGQILSAIFPGTSRSMATIAAGQIAGMSRAASLEFSFFLSIPTMLAATLYKLVSATLEHLAAADAVAMDAHRWGVLGTGFAVSFLVAWAVVAWFMHWVRRHGFAPFAVYRVAIGLTVLILLRNQTVHL